MTSENSIPSPETILFDFDGTLVNTTPLILRSYQATWETCFGFTFADDVYIDTFGTHLRSSLGTLIDLGASTGRHAPPLDREEAIDSLIAQYREFNLAWHDELIEPFPGIDLLLGLIRQRGRQMGIVSSKMRAGVERGLRRFDLGGYFDLIVAAEDVTRHKPDPAPIILAVGRLEAQAATTLYVGDSTHDMHAGRAAGVLTAAAAWGPFPRQALEATRPDYLVDSPAEVGSLLEAGVR